MFGNEEITVSRARVGNCAITHTSITWLWFSSNRHLAKSSSRQIVVSPS